MFYYHELKFVEATTPNWEKDKQSRAQSRNLQTGQIRFA